MNIEYIPGNVNSKCQNCIKICVDKLLLPNGFFGVDKQPANFCRIKNKKIEIIKNLIRESWSL